MDKQLHGLGFLDSTKRMPLMKLPVRTAVVQVGQNRILISPGSQLRREQFASLNDVTDIVAPNLFHCAGIDQASTLYPEARVWGVPGAAKLKPKTKWTHLLTEPTWPYGPELLAIPLGGMPQINETVFLHSPSKSLIVTDLCFNLTETEGLGARLILGMFGTYKRLGVSRFFLKYVKDKAAFQNSINRIFAHDFENIVLSHGELVRGNGKALLRQALAERGYET